MADEAYLKRDYANAAVYYIKVLDDTTVLATYVLPYEAQLVNLKMPSLFTVPELAVTKRKDSTNIAKDDLVQSSKYDFILYRLAQSYRLNYDYPHAAEQFKICVDRGVYPDAGYYYGLSLMNVRKYDEAMKAFDVYVQEKKGSDSLIVLAAKKEAWCYFALDSLVPKKTEIRLMDTLVFNRGTETSTVLTGIDALHCCGVQFNRGQRNGLHDQAQQVFDGLVERHALQYLAHQFEIASGSEVVDDIGVGAHEQLDS